MKEKKLNWVEKIAVKKLIKTARKKIKKVRLQIEDEAKYRERIENSIIEASEILDIRNDKDEEINKETIKTLTTKELEQTLEEALQEMQKLI